MILFKNVTIHNPLGDYHEEQLDILLDQGLIKEIGENIQVEDAQLIEHQNMHVSYGWFDSSVSFGEPGFEERQTMKNGLDTAARSGFTNLMINPNNQPNPQDASGINYLKSLGSNHAVSLHPVGNFSLNQKGEHLAELYDMHQAGAVAFYDYKKSIANANLLKVGLQYIKPFNGILQSFPQDGQIAGAGMINEDQQGTELGLKTMPKFAEELRVARDIEIARYTGASLHIPTLTTNASLELVKKAKYEGLAITCSVTVHHLLLSSSYLKDYDTNFKVQPPLREKSENIQLQHHLKQGTIDMITTDHLPLSIESKNVEFDQADYGTTGLESAFKVLCKNIELPLVLDQLTGAYCRFAAIEPVIKKGAPANLTFFTNSSDSVLTKEDLHSTSKNNMFLGMPVKGKVLGIYNNQKLIWNE